jgi:hypothetical protein
MSAYPTFGEMRSKAKRLGAVIVCQVMMANDDIKTIQFGPRGGWKVLS